MTEPLSPPPGEFSSAPSPKTEGEGERKGGERQMARRKRREERKREWEEKAGGREKVKKRWWGGIDGREGRGRRNVPADIIRVGRGAV